MIEKFEDLGLDPQDKIEKIDEKIKDKLGLSLFDLKSKICESLLKKVEKISSEFTTIAPHGDYGKMLEGQEYIAEFLKSEASKPEFWALEYIMLSDVYANIIEFVFDCSAIDDGDALKGYIYVTFSGKIKHAFASP